MGFLKKLTKPISKFLDKIVPNEIKPALPYLSAFAPFMMGPTGIMGSSMLRRALMSGALNLGSQLAQEGSEGEFNPLSVLLAGSTGAMTSPDAPGFFKGMQREVPYKDIMTDTVISPTPDTGIMASIKHGIGKGGETASNWLQTQGDILRPGGEELTMKNALTAASVPATTGTADLAMADARRALRDYENEMAGAPDAITGGVTDEGRRRAIRAALEAGGHAEETILDALASLGLDLRGGGIVGLKHGGRIGLLRGGDPNDYPQQEDVSVFELQQGEGVPIGPMVKNEFESDMLSALKQAYDEAVKKGYKGSFKQFIQEQGSGIRAAGGGRIGMVSGGGLKAAWATAKGIKNQVVKSLSRMTDDIEMQGTTDFATDTGADFALSVKAKTKKGKKVLDGLVEEGIVELDDGMYYISDMNLDEATMGMGEGKLKASGMLEEGSDKFTRFDEGIGEGPYGGSYYGYDRVIENLKPKKADGGMMSVLPKGKEMDYRGGGVIPVGSRERADDVPARLSKNEFVMTADAVRAAGGGSVNKGAKKMYNLMHNLEARV